MSYVKTNWVNNTTFITAESMNNIEQGIEDLDTGKEPTIATKNTAFNQNFETLTSNIKMNGTASTGTSNNVANADHVHPSDTAKANASDLVVTNENVATNVNSINAINEQLAEKANQTALDVTNINVTNNTNTILLKADKIYTDVEIAKMKSGTPKFTYATLALLQSGQLTDDGNIYCISGYLYVWNGTAWTNSNVQYQSTGISDGIIEAKKLNASIRNSSNKADTAINGTIDSSKFYGDINGYNVVGADTLRFPFSTINDLVLAGATNKIEMFYRIYIDKTAYAYSFTAGGGHGVFFKTNATVDIENGATVSPMGIVSSTFPDKDVRILNSLSYTNQTIPNATYFGMKLAMATNNIHTNYFISLVDVKINDVSIMNRLLTASVIAIAPLGGESIMSASMSVEALYSSLYVPKQYIDPLISNELALNTNMGGLFEESLSITNTAFNNVKDRTVNRTTLNGYMIEKAENVRIPFTSINDLILAGSTNTVELKYQIYMNKDELLNLSYQGRLFFKTSSVPELENGTTQFVGNGAINNKDLATIEDVIITNVAISNSTYFGVNFMLTGDTDITKLDSYFLYIVDLKINGTSIMNRIVTESVNVFYGTVDSKLYNYSMDVIPRYSTTYLKKENLDPILALITNKWKGKKAGFLGDSITYSGNSTKPYHSVMKDFLGLSSIDDEGVTGSAIASDNGSAVRFTVRYTNLASDCNLIGVFGGTNDSAPLGSFTDAPTSANNVSFYGSMHYLCQNLISTYPNATIFFMTPIPRAHTTAYNANWLVLSPYVDAIKKVCAYYSIPVLDLFTASGLFPFDTIQKSINYQTDGLHPSNAGHLIIGEKLARFLLTL